MSNMNAEQSKEAMFAAAAELAEKMGLPESDFDSIRDGDNILISTGSSILSGKIDIDSGRMRTYLYEHYNLNGETLWSKTYSITEEGWDDEPQMSNNLPENAIIYKSW